MDGAVTLVKSWQVWLSSVESDCCSRHNDTEGFRLLCADSVLTTSAFSRTAFISRLVFQQIDRLVLRWRLFLTERHDVSAFPCGVDWGIRDLGGAHSWCILWVCGVALCRRM